MIKLVKITLVERTVLLVLGVLMCGITEEALAAIRPSFEAKISAVRATHIVMATEGQKIDGELQVIESWKGDLKEGDIINIPELAEFAPEESRVIHGWGEAPRQSASGSRLVLFLIKSALASADGSKGQEVEGEKCKFAWLPGSRPSWRNIFAGRDDHSYYKDRMKISVAWIEQGKIYAFVQVINPGPVVLTRTGRSEEQLKTLVLDLVNKQEGFAKAAALYDPVERAKAIVPFTEVRDHRKRETAFKSLAECGAPALPYLREMLKDDALADRHYIAVKALAKAGGTHVGPELTALLEQELALWKSEVPKMKESSWNEASGSLRLRHLKLEQTLGGLDWICFAGCKKVVTEVRDYWRSQPKLEKLSAGRIRRCCNDILRKVEE